MDIQPGLQRTHQVPGLVERFEDAAWVQHRIAGRYTWVVSESPDMLAQIESGVE